MKDWLARGWELEGKGKDREKVPGWGGSETKNTALVGSPQKDCCALGVLGMTSVWWREGCPEQHWGVLGEGWEV